MISFCLFTIVNFLRLNTYAVKAMHTSLIHIHVISDDTTASQVDITVSDIIVRQSCRPPCWKSTARHTRHARHVRLDSLDKVERVESSQVEFGPMQS